MGMPVIENEHAVVLDAIRSAVCNLPPEKRREVELCALWLRSLLTFFGESAQMAIALIGAEMAARE